MFKWEQMSVKSHPQLTRLLQGNSMAQGSRVPALELVVNLVSFHLLDAFHTAAAEPGSVALLAAAAAPHLMSCFKKLAIWQATCMPPTDRDSRLCQSYWWLFIRLKFLSGNCFTSTLEQASAGHLVTRAKSGQLDFSCFSQDCSDPNFLGKAKPTAMWERKLSFKRTWIMMAAPVATLLNKTEIHSRQLSFIDMMSPVVVMSMFVDYTHTCVCLLDLFVLILQLQV